MQQRWRQQHQRQQRRQQRRQQHQRQRRQQQHQRHQPPKCHLPIGHEMCFSSNDMTTKLGISPAVWLPVVFAPLIAGCSDRNAQQGLELTATIQDRLVEALGSTDEADVIVSFRESTPIKEAVDRESHRHAIRKVRDAVLASCGGGLRVTRRYDHVPAVAGRLQRSGLDVLARNPNVAFIQLDDRGHGALRVSVPAIGGDVAKSTYNVSGTGVTVAVLDTGANSSHPDLKSSISATQHCFTHAACPPNNSSESTNATDDHGHGSHVAGIITSDGTIAGLGFAQNAQVVAVKIDDSNDSGYVSDWVAGLDWIYSNLPTLKVKVVNMSICSDQLYGSASACDSGQPALAKSINNLVNSGVAIFAASGNTGSSTQLSAPACNTGVIAVGATYKSSQGRQPQTGTYSGEFGSSFGNCADASTAFDQIACFTNSNSRLDIVAPGAAIVSDYLGTQTGTFWGTSQASPTAAGVAALMLECNPSLTPANVRDILKRTGVSVTDPKNGLSFASIRAAAAVKEACVTTGGAPSTGGSGNSGGSNAATGGNATTGGNVATGGSSGAGGTRATIGGNTATGGTNGALGGRTATTIQLPPTGGFASTIGGTSTNGTGTGGVAVASTGTGGVTATGGTSSIETGGSTTTLDGTRTAGGATGTGIHDTSTVQESGGSSAAASCSCRTAGSPHRMPTYVLASLAVLIGVFRQARNQRLRIPRPR